MLSVNPACNRSTSQKCMEQKGSIPYRVKTGLGKHFTEVHGAEVKQKHIISKISEGSTSQKCVEQKEVGGA